MKSGLVSLSFSFSVGAGLLIDLYLVVPSLFGTVELSFCIHSHIPGVPPTTRPSVFYTGFIGSAPPSACRCVVDRPFVFGSFETDCGEDLIPPVTPIELDELLFKPGCSRRGNARHQVDGVVRDSRC